MGGQSYQVSHASEIEARRLAATKPRDPRAMFDTSTKRGAMMFDRWFKSLPRGNDRIVASGIARPDARSTAKGRKPYHAHRAVDRKIWNKLDGPARTRWLDTIRAELGA